MFYFKQFSVSHSKSAMKIGTDSVLLGSWTPLFNPKKVLDIGSGTGILSLMIAQRTSQTQIDAVEIDREAFLECCENVKNSKWKDRIKVYHSDIELFNKEKGKYDLIISNPPFFTETIYSPNEQRQKARSERSLTFEKLVILSKEKLSENGFFSVIIPFKEERKFIEICENNCLFLHTKTQVKGKKESSVKRSLLLFSSKKNNQIFEEEIVIEKKRHVYTSEYIALTKEFYLKM